VLLHQDGLLVYLVVAMYEILGFLTSLTLLLLLMLHFLQIVQILDVVFCLEKSLNIAVMIVCHHLLRWLLLYFLQDCGHFYFHL
jgi:hypothetical protein